jgi:hypothetical protein
MTRPLLFAVALVLGCSDADLGVHENISADTHTGTGTAPNTDTDIDIETDIDIDTGSHSDNASLPTVVQAFNIEAHVLTTMGSVVRVSWDQATAGDTWLEFSLDRVEWHASPAKTNGIGPQEELILGMPFDHEVTYRVVNDFSEGPVVTQDYTITTGALPPDVPLGVLLSEVPSLQDQDKTYHMTTTTDSKTTTSDWTFIIDRQLRVV